MYESCQNRLMHCNKPNGISVPGSSRSTARHVSQKASRRIHHGEPYSLGDEAAWWQKFNIDPPPVALKLWQHTHGKVAQTSEDMTVA
jgi:hypothetical protein